MKKFLFLLLGIVVNINVFSQCNADFDRSSSTVCVGEPVVFYDQSWGGGDPKTWDWDFGSGASPATYSGQYPPTVTYSTAGQKTITLIYTTDGGTCWDVRQRDINVVPAATVSFTSNSPQCVGQQFNFTYTGSAALTYSWDFGVDATPSSSTIQDPQGITYSSAGTKTVTLTIDNGTCTQTTTQTITVSTTPVASFTSTAPQCTGLDVDFTNTGTTSGVTYLWDFGSGASPSSSTLQNPTGIIYSTSGVKTVTLTITNSSTGCTDVATNTININPTPVSTFTTTAPACSGTIVDFTNTGSTGTGITYDWDFGQDAVPSTSTAENPVGILYSSSGTKLITHTVTNQYGCNSTTVSNITINQTPVADFSATALSCTGDSVNFLNTGTTGATYSWDLGSDATPATSTVESPTVVYSTAGIKTIQLITTLGTCTDTSTQTIEIKQTPAPAFTSNSPQCEGAAIDLTYTGTTGIGWTYDWDFGTGATPSTSTTQIPGSVIYIGAGSKNITLTVSNDICSQTVTGTVDINQTPVADFSATALSCTGDSVNFLNTGTTGATYSWDLGSDATPATSTVESPTVVYSTAGIKTIQLITTLGTCTDTSTQTIEIKQTPAPAFTSNSPQCEGATIDLTYTGTTGIGWTYDWDFGTGATPSTSTTQIPGSVIYIGAGSKNITLTVSNDICSQTVTGTVDINQTPVADFSATALSCTGDSVNFLNTGTLQESPQTYVITVSDSLFTPDSVNAIVGDTIEWIWANGSHTTTSYSIPSGATSWDVTIDSLNQLFQYIVTDTGIYYYISTPDTLAGMAGVINVSLPNVTYSWDFGSDATPATSTVENPTVVYSTAGIKAIQLITTLGTCTDTSTQTIEIKQTPAPAFTSNSPQCEGAAIDLTYTGTTGIGWTYDWDFGTGATPSTSTTQMPGSVIYIGGGSKNITLTVSNDICSQTVTGTVDINPLPIADAGQDTTICANRSVQIGSTPNANDSYSWFPSNTLDNSNISNPIASPIAFITNYVVTVIDTTTGCQNIDSVVVTMLAPLIADAGIDVEICAGDQIQIGAALIEGQNYSWVPATGLDSSNIPSPIASPDSTTEFILTVTGSGCDPVSDEVLVTVHQLPDANAGPDDTITTGASVQLIATGGVQYYWYPSYGLDNPGIYNPIASPEQTTDYIVEVTDIYRCVNTDTMTLTVITPSFWIPNAFTPNGDGRNDILYVRGDGISDFEFKIFDRWGKIIFYSKDMNEGWDGTKQVTGEPVSQGAYVYYIKGVKSNGEPVNVNGMVNLIR